jgi:hypothetical protein
MSEFDYRQWMLFLKEKTMSIGILGSRKSLESHYYSRSFFMLCLPAIGQDSFFERGSCQKATIKCCTRPIFICYHPANIRSIN